MDLLQSSLRRPITVIVLIIAILLGQLALQRAIGGAPEKESGSDVMPRN